MKTKGDKTKQRKLPWIDDPRKNVYIDDGALFVLHLIANGLLARIGSDNFALTMRTPIEWSHEEMLKFLIKVSEEYGFELSDFSTMTYAFTEDYEKDLFDPKTRTILPEYEDVFQKYLKEVDEFEKYKKDNGLEDHGPLPPTKGKTFYIPPQLPKIYEGGYKWALDQIEADTEKGKLFKRIFDDQFGLEDLEQIFKMNHVILAWNEPEDSDNYYQKQITDSIIHWTSFSVDPPEKIRKQMLKDVNAYLKLFMTDKLGPNRGSRRARGASVMESRNIYTFKKHKEMLLEYLVDMKNQFGNDLVFTDPFDEYPLESDTDAEEVKERYKNRKFLFLHTLFAFEYLGCIRIRGLGSNWDWRRDDPTQYEVGLTVLDLQKAVDPIAGNQSVKSIDPIVVIEKGKGYIKLHKNGQKIPIGTITSRKFRLVNILIDPLGTARTVDSIFDAIKLDRDESDSRLKDPYLAKQRKVEIINFTLKELQKTKGLKGKVSIKYLKDNQSAYLELTV